MDNIISSRANPMIKETAKLVASGRERRKNGRFVLEGIRLCFDVIHSEVAVETLLYTSSLAARFPEKTACLREKASRSFEIAEEVAGRLADTPSPQGVFCVCVIPEKSGFVLSSKGKYIALENLRDPANLGAVCRTAEALGIDGAILSSCCDVYSPKAMRSSMGSLLRLPLLLTEDFPSCLQRAKEKGMEVLAAVPDYRAEKITEVSLRGGVIALIGNEGSGLTEQTLSLATRQVTIPMLGRAESLNASMAAAILMWEMMREDGK